MALQKRRGLDFLFIQQRDLCAALKEKCCFHADHCRVVEESMAEVRKGLAKKGLAKENKHKTGSNQAELASTWPLATMKQ